MGGPIWTKTVFTDEKRFCKDGSDNEFSYVEEGGKDVWNHPEHQSKGGGVMVWGDITAKGDMITEDVHLWITNHFPDGNYFFLQEGLKNLEVWILDWPPPTLPTLINYWKHLSNKGYAEGAYNSDDERWRGILKAAGDLKKEKPELLKSL
ncbi:hypothetical protein ILUMI_04746, partial [Ignelater luminosus]